MLHCRVASIVSSALGFFLLYVGWTASLAGDVITGDVAFILGALALIDGTIWYVASLVLARMAEPAKAADPSQWQNG